MAENLNYGSYVNDGKSSDFFQNGSQKFCYNNEKSDCDKYGGLYQWHTAMGFSQECADQFKNCADQISSKHHKGICPSGWHIPKDDEWKILNLYLGRHPGKQMKNFSFGGDNSSGFSALGAGVRLDTGEFKSQNYFISFITAEEVIDYAHNDMHGRSLLRDEDWLFKNLYTKADANSIRCLMD
jgi:uncharacterized protein (TIGR02145 family)